MTTTAEIQLTALIAVVAIVAVGLLLRWLASIGIDDEGDEDL